MIKKNEWYVNCKMPELTGGLAKLARKNGWHRAGNEDSTTDRKFLTCTSGSCICTNNQTYENFEEITIDEAIRRLEAGPPNDDRILVEEPDGVEHEVKIADDGSIRIGCEVIPMETVRELAKLIKQGPIKIGGNSVSIHVARTNGPFSKVSCGDVDISIETVNQIVEKWEEKNGEANPPNKKDEEDPFRGFVEAIAESKTARFAAREDLPSRGSAQPWDMYRTSTAKALLRKVDA